VVLVVVAAVVLAAAAPVLLAVLHALLIAAVVLVVLAAATGAAFAVWRVRRAAPAPPWQRGALQAPRPSRALPEPRPAIEQHVHFHGVTAEDVAAILARQRRED
jgi:hypothetical protein